MGPSCTSISVRGVADAFEGASACSSRLYLRDFAEIGCARSCIALRSGATGALGQLGKYSYLALHKRTTNQGVVGSNPAGRASYYVYGPKT
jgi:hypothetical protein